MGNYRRSHLRSLEQNLQNPRSRGSDPPPTEIGTSHRENEEIETGERDNLTSLRRLKAVQVKRGRSNLRRSPSPRFRFQKSKFKLRWRMKLPRQVRRPNLEQITRAKSLRVRAPTDLLTPRLQRKLSESHPTTLQEGPRDLHLVSQVGGTR